MHRKRLALLVLLAAAPAFAAPTKVRTIEGITEYKLDNGLQVLLIPDPASSTVTVDTVFHVGSRHEGYGETGMAHLIEHMVFKGSPRHRDVWNLLAERGSINQDGITNYDTTRFYSTLPASQENLDWQLDLYSDLMANASITDDDLAKEFAVVRNEFEIWESKPHYMLSERVQETAFLWHAYGHSVSGSRSDIERVPGSALRAFHTRFYQPDNATLIVAGQFDVARALATIDKTFGAIPKPTRVLPDTYTVEPQQDGERRVVLERTGDVHVVTLAYHIAAGASPDYAPIAAAASMLAREPTGRLYKKIVETQLASSLGWEVGQQHDPALVTFTAEVPDGKNVDQVEKIMASEIEGLGGAAMDLKELDRWRIARHKQLDLGLSNTAQLAIDFADWVALGDWRTLFAYRDQLAHITLADVTRVAKAYFVHSNRTVGRFVPTAKPERAPLATAPNVADVVKNVREGASADDGEVFAATLDNLAKRTVTKTLAGGITSALVVKKTRHHKVHLRLVLHWGDEKSLHDQAIPGLMLADLMMHGTAHKSYQQLVDAEEQLEASISMSSGAAGLVLEIDSVRDDLGPAVALAIEMLTEPSLSAKDFEIIRQQWLANLETNQQDPETVSNNMFYQTVWPRPAGDPRRTLAIQEQIDLVKKLKLADVQRFDTKLAGASHGELAVVGDFDAAAITAQIEALSAKWPAKAPYVRLTHDAPHVAGKTVEIPLPDKENALIDVGEDIAIRDSDPDYPAMVMVNQVLGATPASRVWQHVRSRDGLSYDAWSWFAPGSFDAAGDFGVYANCAPQNLVKVEAALTDELRTLATGTISANELQRAKDAWARAQDSGLADDAALAHTLASHLELGRDSAFSRDLRAKVAALQPADVERVARRSTSIRAAWSSSRRTTRQRSERVDHVLDRREPRCGLAATRAIDDRGERLGDRGVAGEHLVEHHAGAADVVEVEPSIHVGEVEVGDADAIVGDDHVRGSEVAVRVVRSDGLEHVEGDVDRALRCERRLARDHVGERDRVAHELHRDERGHVVVGADLVDGHDAVRSWRRGGAFDAARRLASACADGRVHSLIAPRGHG